MTPRIYTYEQNLSVSFAYPVVFTRDLFDPQNPVLDDELARAGGRTPHQAAVYIDAGVAAAHPGLEARIVDYFARRPGRLALAFPPRVVPGGEGIKGDMELLRDLMHQVSRSGLCRHSYVIAIGGGAMLDAVGFAAALVHRGLRLVRVPTTVLAQNDAGVGVKNGLNTDGGKNTVGTFAPPYAVLNDFAFLSTLGDTDWIAGAAEAFKVAIIKDANFFDFLARHAAALRARDAAAMEKLIIRCAELHLDHIRSNGDPFELGTARPLDFGHWSAHKLEGMSGYRIRHGHAVAAGIALDSCYARRQGWISAAEFEAIRDSLTACGFPLWYEEYARRAPDGTPEIFDGLRGFREHLGGELCITFPRGIGNRMEVHEIDLGMMGECLDELMRTTSGAERVQGSRFNGSAVAGA